LAKEEHPVRMAGRVVIVRERVSALLDSPYAAFPATTVQGVDNTVEPRELISIENLTTFHQEAKRHCDDPILLVYTNGAPSPAWRSMYERLLRSLSDRTRICHWGDVDEGGFRIAAQLSQVVAATGRVLEPYRMRPREIPAERRRPATKATLERMRYFAAQAGWKEVAEEIDPESGFTVEQEALDASLGADM
jgi:hypothetical protein